MTLGDRLRSDMAKKAVKYASVSLVGVVSTQVMIIVFHGLLKLSFIPTNILAVSISSVPAYLLNRAWVWGKKGKNDFKREVLPFWAFAFAGLVLSTVLVGLAEEYIKSHAESHTTETLFLSGANLTGFGVLWVARFFVLDRLLFKDAHVGESFLEHLAEDAPLA